MAELEIIDIHTHTFASADRGIGWQKSAGHANPVRNGTIEELVGIMAGANITHAVQLMYTPTRFMYEARIKSQELPSDPAERESVQREVQTMMAQRMIANNEWALGVSAEHPNLFTFAGLDPVYMDEATLVGEIEDKVARGARGVKIVPLALAAYVDDPRMMPMYETIARLGVPIVSQAGAGGEVGDRGDHYGRPKYFETALQRYPDLVINIAHLGHGYEDDVIDLCRRFPGFHADLSSRLHELDDPNEHLTDESLVDFIRQCGAEHILFGTNYPLNSPQQYADVMRRLPLTDREKELVAHGNAKRLLKLA
ncbi:MAG: amidohydrolase family protein [Dehalococcoidia bacterium]